MASSGRGSTTSCAADDGDDVTSHHVGATADHATAAQYVAAAIRERVVSGSEAAGTRPNQRKLAEELGVSVIPLRRHFECCRLKASSRSSRMRGAFVTSLSPRELNEIFVIREQLDPLATKVAVGRLSEDELESLRRILEAMELATRSGNLDRLSKLNRGFHGTIHDGARMPIWRR